MIQKKIFYVWGAAEEKRRDVLACMQSWYQACPEYEIIEINKQSKDYFDFKKELNNNRWFKTIYDRKMWAYVADYIRIKVLHDHGGIYLDTDVTVLKNFDKFLSDPAFVGMQDNAIDRSHDLVEPAILGANKSNPILKSILDFYKDDVWKLPIFSMPDLFNYALKKLYGKNTVPFKKKEDQTVIKYPDIYIYPEKIFIPFRFREKFSQDCIKNETHTIHWWGSSWVRREILFFLENKHKMSAENLEKIEGYIRTFYLFCFLPVLKVFVTKDEVRIANIPLLKIDREKRIESSNYSLVYEIKLFNCVSLFKVLTKGNNVKRKYCIFNIPVLKISSV